MVEWEAANLQQANNDANTLTSSPSSSSSSNPKLHPHVNSQQPSSLSRSSSTKQRKNETPEAALARLTASYSIAMKAVGSLHKLSDSIVKREERARRRRKKRQTQKAVEEIQITDSEKKDLMEDNDDVLDRVDSTEENQRGPSLGGALENENETEDKDKDKDIESTVSSKNKSLSVEDEGKQQDHVANDDKKEEGTDQDLLVLDDMNPIVEDNDESMQVTDDKSTTPTTTAAVDKNNAPNEEEDKVAKEDDELEASLIVVRRVAKAAREAFETGILTDPLIAPYVPTTISLLLQRDEENSNTSHYIPGGDGCGGDTKSILQYQQQLSSSAANVTALKQLAYASLLNYADLLWCGCTCGLSQRKNDSNRVVTMSSSPSELEDSILDNQSSVVKILGVLLLLNKDDGEDEDDSDGNQNDMKMTDLHGSYDLNESLWNHNHDEKIEERTKRLMLVAYCDAADLDGSDPTIWLKVACTARRLGRFVSYKRVKGQHQKSLDGDVIMNEEGEEEETTATVSKSPSGRHKTLLTLPYQRLERYALERGMKALKVGLPPNRAISLAFREFEEQTTGEADEYITVSDEEQQQQHQQSNLIIDLPRYSWSTLGRILMRACREGIAESDQDCRRKGDAGRTITSASSSSSSDTKSARNATALPFGSPCVQIKISPLLTLPPTALGTVCEFLGLSIDSEMSQVSPDIKRFESTCRSLSVEIISARASMEKDRNLRIKQMEQEMLHISRCEDNNSGGDSSDKESDENKSGGGGGGKEENDAAKRSHRTSKRVQSQLISSGKQAERSAKRKSVEYCLASVVLACTMGHPVYVQKVKEESNWGDLSVFQDVESRRVMLLSGNKKKEKNPSVGAEAGAFISISSKERLTRRIVDATARTGKSSLNSFLQRWSKRNSGPLDILHRFLCHISLYVDDVYASDHNRMMLTSCVSECFEILLTWSNAGTLSNTLWYGGDYSANLKSKRSIETYAMNLFFTELRMRKCERRDVSQDVFDEDAHAVKCALPYLLHYSDSLGEADISESLSELFLKMQIRTHWLAAIFFVWWSRKATELCDVQEAEEAAIRHIEKAISLFESVSTGKNLVIPTPHLESPGRSGVHWTELSVTILATFKDEFEASTVVSRSRHKFRDRYHQLHEQGRKSVSEFSTDDKESFSLFGKELLERYGLECHEGSGKKFDELINDFVSLYGSEMDDMGLGENESTENEIDNRGNWGMMWDSIPSTEASPIEAETTLNPSLVTILAHTLQCQNDYEGHLMCFVARLVVAALEERNTLLGRKEELNIIAMLSTDDNSDSDSDDSGFDSKCNKGSSIGGKTTVLLNIAKFFVSKLIMIILGCQQANAFFDFVETKDLLVALQMCIEASSSAHLLPGQKIELMRNRPHHDCVLLRASLSLAAKVGEKLDKSKHMDLLSTVFSMLVKELINQRHVLPNVLRSKSTRSEHINECINCADYIAILALEITGILSNFPCTFEKDGVIKESIFIRQIVSLGTRGETFDPFPLAKLSESLAWFWVLISTSDILETSAPSPTVNAMYRRLAPRIVLPIAAAIISLCNAAGYGKSSALAQAVLHFEAKKNRKDDTSNLSDYFDSDASAKDWDHGHNPNEEEEESSQRHLLHTLCRTIQCIGLVFSGIDDKTMSSTCKFILSKSSECFYLPLITVRVLTEIADFVLQGVGRQNGDVWATEYPFGFRSAGAHLDSLLHKAYRCLHGIQLASNTTQNAAGRDAAVPPVQASLSPLCNEHFPPESVKAAAQLYRCIMRIYANGRRAIPVPALQCVAAALPRSEKNKDLLDIEAYIFDRNVGDSIYKAEEECNLLKVQNDVNYEEFPPCVLQSQRLESENEVCEPETIEQVKSDVYLVQKGICEHLADGPLPRLGSSTSSSTSGDDGTVSHGTDERKMTIAAEFDLNEKFEAIIKALQYNASNYESWYRAGLCLGFKADIIMDRLPSARSCDNKRDFYVPGFSSLKARQEFFNRKDHNSISLSKLLQQQYDKFEQNYSHLSFLGQDLSLYTKYQWSNFDKLLSLQSEVEDALSKAENVIDSDLEIAILDSIKSLYMEGKFAEWQEAWGGVFVSALLFMSKKCHKIALHLAGKKDDIMFCEIAENLGTVTYNEVMLSTSYGYPMNVLTDYERRQKAREAQSYFERAVAFFLANPDSSKTDDSVVVWELQFMIGKCQEKVAKTVRNEMFHEDTGEGATRMYQLAMTEALKSYTDALKEGKNYVDEGKSLEVSEGGSSHGLTEVTYRIHASRFKVLLSAVKKPKKERDMAENEALMITEKHWFEEPDQIETDKETPKNIRTRIWNVLADIVSAMAFCRRSQSFFHRSVYRHAQALLWAPIFDNPEGALKQGSLASVAAFKSYKLRGLNSGSCANSAEVVMGVLFEKKRPQLVAVWVTTPTSPTPFAFLNDTTRKYDYLRGKYIQSYIDCMRLCKRRETLETFIGLCGSSRRDLVSYYSASAAARGGDPKKWLHNENLLIEEAGLIRFATRSAIAAVANVIRETVVDMTATERTKEWKEKVLVELGEVYKCFLRLNCSLNEGIWQSQRFKRMIIEGSITEVEVLCDVSRVINDPNYVLNTATRVPIRSESWESRFRQVQLVMKRCSRLFPAFCSLHDFTKRRAKKKRKNINEDVNDDNSDLLSELKSKRSRADENHSVNDLGS